MNIASSKLTFKFNSFMNCCAVDKIKLEILRKISSKNSTEVVFDMIGVKYVSSSFINLCVSALKISHTHSLKVINLEPFVKHVFRISGLSETFNIRQSLYKKIHEKHEAWSILEFTYTVYLPSIFTTRVNTSQKLKIIIQIKKIE